MSRVVGVGGRTRRRAWGIALGATLGTVGVGALLLPDVLADGHRVRAALASGDATVFPDALVLGCEALTLLCAGWVWLLVVLVLRDVLREVPQGAPRRSGGVPPAVRRLVLAACGLTLAGVVATPAAGGTRQPHEEPLAGLALPDRVTGATPTRSPAPGGRGRPAAVRAAPPGRDLTVVVSSGDTLWALAARSLTGGAEGAEGAGPAAIDRRWRALYRANADRIGPDPDLIRPGQRLRVPPLESP